MASLEQAGRIGGAGLLGIPAFDFFVWALDTYARGDLLMSLHDRLPPLLLNPGIGFLCMCGGLGLLYMAQKRYLASIKESKSSILDSRGKKYSNDSAPRGLIPVSVVFLLALFAAPILSLSYSLAYKGTPPHPPKGVTPPPFAFLTTRELESASHPKAAININQQGKNNIAQVGNNNTASITSAIPFRILTENQKQGIAAFLQTMPPSVMVSVGGVYGSGDAVIYAGDFFPLFEGRHLDNQTTAAIRTGFSVDYTDVIVAARTDEDSAVPYRDALVKTLTSLGIPAHPANGSKVPPGDLEFLVGFRPEEVKQQ
jgi:hypothetical protein